MLDFFSFFANRVFVYFKPKLNYLLDSEVEIELMRSMSYDEVVAKLAQEINVNDSKCIRLSSHDKERNCPFHRPISYSEFKLERKTLRDMIPKFPGSHNDSFVLYYEVVLSQSGRLC